MEDDDWQVFFVSLAYKLNQASSGKCWMMLILLYKTSSLIRLAWWRIASSLDKESTEYKVLSFHIVEMQWLLKPLFLTPQSGLSDGHSPTHSYELSCPVAKTKSLFWNDLLPVFGTAPSSLKKTKILIKEIVGIYSANSEQFQYIFGIKMSL